jgi:hypothetical protein
MNTNRSAGIIVGLLYIVGTVAGVLSAVVTKPLFGAADPLASVAADERRLRLGALLVLTMGLALALVPVVAFPILKRHHEVLALGYLIFRGALEMLTYAVTIVAWLLLAALGRAYAGAGSADLAGLRALGAAARGVADSGTVLASIIFPLGALMFYAVLYRANLIPRWLAGWGLLVVIPYLAAGLLALFRAIGLDSTTYTLLVLPMLVQEMVMAVWLIVRGFNPAASVAAPTPGALPGPAAGGRPQLA